MSRIKQVLFYLDYTIHAKSKHGVHSPFVFDLLCNVINNRDHYYAYDVVENLRSELMADSSELFVNDFGVGSKGIKGHGVSNQGVIDKRSIRDIAKHSAKSPKYAQLLFRMVNHFQPRTIIELGTSLGITTLYLALGNSKAKVISMEGCENIAARALKNFRSLEVSNIHLVRGNFDDVLEKQLMELNNVDFVFFDGNHRKDATLKYFECCLKHAHADSVFVFDDIYWSGEMHEAWESIKQHPLVKVSIDLFFFGIVFFRREQVKENFVLRF